MRVTVDTFQIFPYQALPVFSIMSFPSLSSVCDKTQFKVKKKKDYTTEPFITSACSVKK